MANEVAAAAAAVEEATAENSGDTASQPEPDLPELDAASDDEVDEVLGARRRGRGSGSRTLAMDNDEAPVASQMSREEAAKTILPPRNALDQLPKDPLERAIAYGKMKYAVAKKSDTFDIGVNMMSEEEQRKRAQRYSRFGISKEAESDHANPDIKRARQSRFGLSIDVNKALPQNCVVGRRDPQKEAIIRPEAIHIYGLDKMSTRNIMDIFVDFVPSHIEWINDSSCNVVFPTENSAGRALWALAEELPTEYVYGVSAISPAADAESDPTSTSKIGEPESDVGSEVSAVKTLNSSESATNASYQSGSYIPDNTLLRWRRLVSSKCKNALIVRCATTDDVKKLGAAKESKYYKRFRAERKRRSGSLEKAAEVALVKRVRAGEASASRLVLSKRKREVNGDDDGGSASSVRKELSSAMKSRLGGAPVPTAAASKTDAAEESLPEYYSEEEEEEVIEEPLDSAYYSRSTRKGTMYADDEDETATALVPSWS